MGRLKEDARAVAGIGLAATGAAVAQVDQHSQRMAQDLVRAAPVDVGDKTDAARRTLAGRVVKGITQ